MNKIDLYIEDEFDIYNEEYTKDDLSNLVIINKTISNTTLDRCNLTTSDYKNTYFEKVVFSNCDLSNTKFIECNFREVEFINCKLVGISISNCHMTKTKIKDSLNTYIEKAPKLDSEITKELIDTIFMPGTALHDGAVIIRENRIMCAGAFYPTSETGSIPKTYGSRHRAAIGISEDSDAFTVIVSEESGRVSTTLGGTITQGLSEEALRLSLTNHIIIQ